MHDEDDDAVLEPPSKSELKRQANAITHMGEQLLSLSAHEVAELPYPEVIAALEACRKITKGNARKRQLQYIGKLMRNLDLTPVQALIDRFDASSNAHNLHFHQLEIWRERLLDNDPSAIDEIASSHPDLDLQHLMQLVRHALKELQKGIEPPVHFRKLFQYLKSLP